MHPLFQEQDASGNLYSNKGPIFILGILQRSGTNYLYNLLLLHPDCGDPAPVWEDYFVHHADLISKYVKLISRQWGINGKEGEILEQQLYEQFGNGLLNFLQSKAREKRLVAKTPSVNNLDIFFRLFPRAKLIIIVRDGRAVIESGKQSFGWDYDIAMKRWAEAANNIRSFKKRQNDANPRYLLVRYEDIYKNVEEEMIKILTFLDLDARLYDFNAARNLPIRGTSELARWGEKGIHWDPVQKKPGFDPTHRTDNWGRALNIRFNHIAGYHLYYFGYSQKKYRSFKLLWKIWNLTLDIKLFLLWNLRKIKRSSLIIHRS